MNKIIALCLLALFLAASGECRSGGLKRIGSMEHVQARQAQSARA